MKMMFSAVTFLLVLACRPTYGLPANSSQTDFKPSSHIPPQQFFSTSHKSESQSSTQHPNSIPRSDPITPKTPGLESLPGVGIPVNNPVSADGSHRQGRIFFPGFSSGLTGNPSLSSVLTLNLNNLAMVGLFLIGVFILLPSIVGFLTGLTGGGGQGYAAKSLRADDQSSYMWTIMQTLDSALSKNNIDVRVCLERAACHVAKNSYQKAQQGTPSTMESVLNYALSSSYGQNLLSSYRLKEATDKGKSGQDCDSQYNKCPYSLNNLTKLISTYYSFGSAFSPSVPPKPANAATQ